jgi:multidrug efflux pump subunit AcrB
MAFVSGMMGPYMSPMPIGASIAMILSLFVALTVTLFRISFITRKDDQKQKDAEGLETSQVYKIYNRLERPLLESSMKEEYLWGDSFAVDRFCCNVFTKSVLVKMLPFDNKMNFK